MTTFRFGIFCLLFDILPTSARSYHARIDQGQSIPRHAMQINIIVVTDMCQLDTTGAFEVLARVPGWTIDLVAASMEPVRTDYGLTIMPTQTRESAKPSDILVVPGGRGIDDAMLDDSWIAFAQREAAKAQYV